MRSLVRSSLALVGLSAVLSPVVAHAQNTAPAGYAPAAGNVMVMGLDGKPVMAQLAASSAPAPAPAPAPMPTEAPAPHKHNHNLKAICANCLKKQQAMPMPTGRIVACAHSKNGVCPTCQSLLAMPGTVTVGAPATLAPAEAPGRAMVSNQPSAPATNSYAQSNPVAAVYDPSTGPEPTPIGVMQTNYSQPGAVPAGPSSVPTAASVQPGHALAASGGNSAPFQHKSTSSANPHILGHIFGYSGRYSEWRETQNNKKAAAHASIPYNNEGTTVNEIPASMVYDRR